jgi:hypothetical protein
MQTINFDELREDRNAMTMLVFIRAVVAADCELQKSGTYDVEFRVQGKEVNLLDFCAAFDAHWHSAVVSAARDQLESVLKFSGVLNKLAQLEQRVCGEVDNIMTELGAQPEG